MGKCEQCIVKEFCSLKELTREELMRISQSKVSKTLKKGEMLFDEGEYINGLFCIKSGVCKVSKMSENSRDQIVHLAKKGDLIGERSLISDEITNLKAVAVNDMEVCFIPKEEIIRDLEENHNFTMSVLKTMATNLKNADNIIVNMGQKTVKQRLAQTLLYLKDKFGLVEENKLDITLTREDIANIIGTATETTIRLLSDFKKREIIHLKGKDIFILKPKELKAISEGL